MTSHNVDFPPASVLGFPRIGPNRELKRSLEEYWSGKISREELKGTTSQLRLQTYQRLASLGLSVSDASIPQSFSYYDQVLDVTSWLGATPKRFSNSNDLDPLDLYFLLARGSAGIPPLEMTKWFNTNYHYLVPEIGPDTPISLALNTPVELFLEARKAGINVRPTLVGPLTYLLLAKPAIPGYEPLERLNDVLDAYSKLLGRFADAGATWVQLDEPGVTSDNLGVLPEKILTSLRYAYQTLGGLSVQKRPALLVTTPYGEARDAIAILAKTPIEAIHADLVHGSKPKFESSDWVGKTLVAGSINGRNIWRADLSGTLDNLFELNQELPANATLAVSTSTSLQHVPYDTSVEKWDDPELDTNLHLWLAFADQKVQEVAAIATGLTRGAAAIPTQLRLSDQAKARRRTASGVTVPSIRAAVDSINANDRQRVDFALRERAQDERFSLPPLPTTTIGSYPQTPDIRRARAANTQGLISGQKYQEILRDEIRSVIKLQVDLGLDVLVHGEPERNDMVQYFAELLSGFAVTRLGWVQSYGSRCTRPSVLWGDVSRPGPLTIDWITFAQSLTDRPVKGMLTGPVTILAWSFVREDLGIGTVAAQVALALREEVIDLETAGIGIIQVDEPALRELLPLRLSDQVEYLEWSIGSFRLATAGVRPETQIHTHLCYSEFADVISAIDDLDADVTSLEAARSAMEVLPALTATGFSRGIGPGIYDIHSPRIPTADELADLIHVAQQAIPARRLWINPDCGLKTRTYAEVTPALRNLVQATKDARATLRAVEA